MKYIFLKHRLVQSNYRTKAISCTNIIVILLIIVGLLVTNCETITGTEDDELAYVRFIHMAAGTDEIDFIYKDLDDDYYYVIVYEVTYGEQYGYYYFVADSNRNFRAYLSGTNLVVASATITLEEDGKYSILATDFGTSINPSLLVISDTTITPSSGKVFLRFLHASADAPELDIIGDKGVFTVTNLSQYQNSTYTELDAGTYEYSVVSSDTGSELLHVDAMTLISGVSYIIILSGSISGLPGPEFNAKIYQETSVEGKLE